MPRKVRIEYEGATYHVMCRGNRREAIFLEDADRRLFLETLGECCARSGWIVHAYVLMGNHYHLLLETPEANLCSGMKWFQGTYTQRFNSRHRRVGHLYQGRYKSQVVDAEESVYFNVLSSYIHLNPVRASMIRVGEQPLKDYAWSSYPSYLKPAGKRPAWLDTRRVRESFLIDRDDARGRRRYERLMEERVLEESRLRRTKKGKDEVEHLRRGWYVGGEDFRDRMLDEIESLIRKDRHREIGKEARRDHGKRAAVACIRECLKVLRLDEEELPGLRKGDPRKQAIACVISERSLVDAHWLAERLQMGHRMNVTRAKRRLRGLDDPELVRMKRRLDAMLRC